MNKIEDSGMSSLYILLFPENRAIKIGKANDIYKRSLTLKKYWGVPDYENSYELVAPQSSVFRMEKSLHFLLANSRLAFESGDGKTEMFSLDALETALKCVEMFVEAGSVDAVLKLGVSEAEIKKPKNVFYGSNRIYSKTDKSRNSRLFLDRTPKIVDCSPVTIRKSNHVAWALFTIKNPAASALLHILTSSMDKKFTVTASCSVLAEMVGCSERSISTAVETLAKALWIDVVRSDRGSVNTYVVRQGARK